MKKKQNIVKTRHPKADKPKGILYPKLTSEKSYHQRYLPSQDLKFFIEHFWIVKWELPEGTSFTAETLPHPSIHIVFEKDKTRVVGVMEKKFSRVLKGKGKVFGIKFVPGGFYPFIKKPVSELTNKLVEFNKMFEDDVRDLENSILTLDNDDDMIEAAESYLRTNLPEKDNNVETMKKIAELIISNKEIVKVDNITARMNINKRTLQRLFRQYVGVTPKWMIKRYRLHEAGEKLSDNPNEDMAKLALELGYYDQAHFIKDFKSVVGKTPAEYVKSI